MLLPSLREGRGGAAAAWVDGQQHRQPGRDRNTMPKLVLCRAVHPDAMALLEARRDIEVTLLTKDFRGPPLEKELLSAIGDADGIMIGLERIEAGHARGWRHELQVISRFGASATTRSGYSRVFPQGAVLVGVVEQGQRLCLGRRARDDADAGRWHRRTVGYDASGAGQGQLDDPGSRASEMHELAGRAVLVVGYKGGSARRWQEFCTALRACG